MKCKKVFIALILLLTTCITWADNDELDPLYYNCEWQSDVAFAIAHNRDLGASDEEQVEYTITEGIVGEERLIIWGWIKVLYEEPLNKWSPNDIQQAVWEECVKALPIQPEEVEV